MFYSHSKTRLRHYFRVRTIALLFCVAIQAGCSASSGDEPVKVEKETSKQSTRMPNGWEQVTGKLGEFRIAFPGKPEYDTETDDGVRFSCFEFRKNQDAYLLGCFDFSANPQAVGSQSELMDEFVSNLCSLAPNPVISKTNWHGAPARHVVYQFESENQPLDAELKAVFKNDRLFLLGRQWPRNARPSEDVNLFFDSLSIMSKAEVAVAAQRPDAEVRWQLNSGFQNMFTFETPGRPAMLRRDILWSSEYDYTVNTPGKTYKLVCMSPTSDLDFEGIAEFAAENLDGVIVEQKEFKWGIRKDPAIRYVIRYQSGGQEAHFVAREIVVASTRYRQFITGVGVPGKWDNENRFFNSFRLNKFSEWTTGD